MRVNVQLHRSHRTWTSLLCGIVATVLVGSLCTIILAGNFQVCSGSHWCTVARAPYGSGCSCAMRNCAMRNCAMKTQLFSLYLIFAESAFVAAGVGWVTRGYGRRVEGPPTAAGDRCIKGSPPKTSSCTLASYLLASFLTNRYRSKCSACSRVCVHTRVCVNTRVCVCVVVCT